MTTNVSSCLFMILQASFFAEKLNEYILLIILHLLSQFVTLFNKRRYL